MRTNKRDATDSPPIEIKIPDGAHPDNLTLSDDGYVYVAAQHGTFRAGAHLSLSSRFRLRGSVYRFRADSPPDVAERVHVEVPRDHRAPSTALRRGNKLYVSQIIGDQVWETEAP